MARCKGFWGGGGGNDGKERGKKSKNGVNGPRMNANERESEVVDDPLPFYLGLLEVNQEGDFQAGRFEVVEALGEVLIGKGVHTLEFDDQLVLDEDVGEIVAYGFALVGHRERGLGSGLQTPQDQLLHQGALVNFLQKSGAED